MRSSSPHYFPLSLPLGIVLFLVIALLVALIEIGVLEYTYLRLGIDPRWFASLLLLSLLGSMINLPVAELPAGPLVEPGAVRHFGVTYRVPRLEAGQHTILAVNLGGAIVPTALSLYLVGLHGFWVQAAIAVAAVAAVTHRLARPVRGVGIAVPMLVPPIAAAAVALVLSPGEAAALAYAAGTLGTLIGADLSNLGRLRGLGAPVVSIGGAGTFDGVFVTGVLAVLLA